MQFLYDLFILPHTKQFTESLNAKDTVRAELLMKTILFHNSENLFSIFHRLVENVGCKLESTSWRLSVPWSQILCIFYHSNIGLWKIVNMDIKCKLCSIHIIHYSVDTPVLISWWQFKYISFWQFLCSLMLAISGGDMVKYNWCVIGHYNILIKQWCKGFSSFLVTQLYHVKFIFNNIFFRECTYLNVG